MKDPIRIGTRDSELALWQAKKVQQNLEDAGYKTILVPVKSAGDINLTQPLYEMGITGIFTKTLDLALVNGTIDIAVHSLKDVPTQMPHGMVTAAILERASSNDILVYKKGFNPDQEMTIATGSLRRKAQWLNMYKHHNVEDLRGNVNTRLAKLYETKHWNAAIFAKAGLDRIDLLAKLRSHFGFEYIDLDSATPAPAQGAMMIAAMETNTIAIEACSFLHHKPTAICVQLERDFLRNLEGGCTAPIGALAQIKQDVIHFKGCLFSLDGAKNIEISQTLSLNSDPENDDYSAFAKAMSDHILSQGGIEVMKNIKIALDQ